MAVAGTVIPDACMNTDERGSSVPIHNLLDASVSGVAEVEPVSQQHCEISQIQEKPYFPGSKDIAIFSMT